MALKELLVEGDVLQPHNALPRVDFEDPVHEQEGIPVRQYPQNVGDVVDEGLIRPGTDSGFRSRARIRHAAPSDDSSRCSLAIPGPPPVRLDRRLGGAQNVVARRATHDFYTRNAQNDKPAGTLEL